MPDPAKNPPAPPELAYDVAQLADQGRLGPFLARWLGEELAAAHARARAANLPTQPPDEECMAADDFYFSVIDLMDGCFLARDGDELVGAACVNPYVSELQYAVVDPRWRRRGVGRRLVAMALAHLARRGSDHVGAEVALAHADAGGRAFLEAMGFAEIRRRALFARALEPAPPADA